MMGLNPAGVSSEEKTALDGATLKCKETGHDLVGLQYGLSEAYDAQANFCNRNWCRRCLWSHRYFPVPIC
uniref:Uncharacterized protein n=1 Tax=Romanomermis culicivorax TaxID=13658 RepID=A0A915I8S9_ROMCU